MEASGIKTCMRIGRAVVIVTVVVFCLRIGIVLAFGGNYGDGAYNAGVYGGQSVLETSVTLMTSPNPSAYGSVATLVATVSPSDAEGVVEFKDAGSTIGSVTLGHGSGAFALSTFTVGIHALTATYSGSTMYPTATSGIVNHVVGKIPSSLVLTSSPNPSVAGQIVRLNAAVTPADASGTVLFSSGGTTLGSVPLGHGSGSLLTSGLQMGNSLISAVYNGNVLYLSGTGNTVTQVVNKMPTVTTLVSSLNPSTYGSSTILRATVAPANATGTMTFRDGAAILGLASVGHGSGALAVASLNVAVHTLTADYSGDALYLPSTSNTVSQIVTKRTTSTTLSVSPNSSVYGANVQLKATVSPSTATGIIVFKDGSATIGMAPLGHGSGRITVSSFAVGTHSLSAAYAGSSNDAPSTSSIVSHSVSKAPTTTSIVSSLNPSVQKAKVTFTATVSPATATGTLRFDGFSFLGIVTVGHGSGSLSTTSLIRGANPVRVRYSGNGVFAASTSPVLWQQVNK